MQKHYYVDRKTGSSVEEQLVGDRTIRYLYSTVRENANFIFNLAISKHTTKLLSFFNYNKKLNQEALKRYITKLNIDPEEIYEFESIKTLEDLFMRKISYWEKRPMESSDDIIVSPADSKMVVGSLNETSLIPLKNKFFHFEELLFKPEWVKKFSDGDFAIFRLTPDEYHYNHLPVSGVIEDIYELDGAYHSCNPSATVAICSPLSKNRRVVTIIDTDVTNGSKIGMVAFVEVVAMMIGQIVQAYSDIKYENPRPLKIGDFVKKGQPKSVYKPGSSTDIIIFEKDKVAFDDDILFHTRRKDLFTRYTLGFGKAIVEIKVRVRERIGRRI